MCVVSGAHIDLFRHTVRLHGRQQLHDGDNLQAQHGDDVVALKWEESKSIQADADVQAEASGLDVTGTAM